MNPFFKTKKPPLKACGGQIQFHEQKVDLPAEHGLHDFGLMDIYLTVKRHEFISKIDMNKSKSQSITAHHPPSVRDEVFAAGGCLCKPGCGKPCQSHYCKAEFTNVCVSACVVHCQRNNQHCAQQTSGNIDASQKSVPVGAGFSKIWLKKDRAKQNSWNGCGDMGIQEDIVEDEVFFEERRRDMQVSIHCRPQKELERHVGTKNVHIIQNFTIMGACVNQAMAMSRASLSRMRVFLIAFISIRRIFSGRLLKY